jgi:hypothetical protein
MDVLFLDDNPLRTKKFRSDIPFAHCVQTAEKCIKTLQSEPHWDYLFLDHDLGGETYVKSDRADCGMEVVRWLCDNPWPIDQIIVHSCNKPAADNMTARLTVHGYEVKQISFINLGPILRTIVQPKVL